MGIVSSILEQEVWYPRIKGKRLNVNYFTEEYHVKEYAKAKYGWLDITDTTYGDNASSDDNSVSDAPDSTTPNILLKQQTAILPDDAMSSIVTMVETNISQSSQHQRHPKKVLIKMEEQLASSEGPKCA